jgi:uncharacterized protein with ParB-like and HNH nuclease domain
MSDRIILKSISSLLEKSFFIPHYQRGYRWTDQQVKDLLNDIDSFVPRNIQGTDEKTFYCLQPIVVKESNEKVKIESALSGKWYEVIDGQQRLTTIFLIIHYANEMWVGKQKNPEFNIKYETRKKSTVFLESLQIDDSIEGIDKSNIDFYHISKAYDTINSWVVNYKNNFNKEFDNNEFQSKIKANAKVIWYEVEEKSNSIELFTRLNMGKIPLTNAELIKALFLSSSSFEGAIHDDVIRKKIEISQLWDEIEQKLGDHNFWSFATNLDQSGFPTKIELLFDMIANKKQGETDPLFTFLYFLNQSKNTAKPLWGLWLSIEQYYLTICEWYKDKNLYHKVGYLIAVGENISNLIAQSMNEKKKDFEAVLNKKIQESVDFDLETLSYERSVDQSKIAKLLLLFNVESIRSNETISEYYPFKLHKHEHTSLEHIHAQNSESLDKTKKEPWFKWLHYHKALIEELASEEKNNEALTKLLNEVVEFDNDNLTWEKFNSLSKKIIDKFSENEGEHSNELHSVSNLALLSQPDNAALNNAVFEVKRREIIRMDKEGKYIPLCTRRVFFKYYNDKPSSQHYYFWSKEDRFNYLKEIKSKLRDYLPKEQDQKN